MRGFYGFVELLPLEGEARFIGVTVQKENVLYDLNLMRQILGEAAYFYEQCFIRKYGNSYHLTLVNTPEFQSLDNTSVGLLTGRRVFVEILGLGRASQGACETYYVVCRSEEMSRLREVVGYGSYDFHITLGFNGQDVHGVGKGVGTLINAVP